MIINTEESNQNFTYPAPKEVTYLPFLSIPILVVSLVLGYFIRDYYKTLDNQQKNIVILLDIGINHYVQEILEN